MRFYRNFSVQFKKLFSYSRIQHQKRRIDSYTVTSRTCHHEYGYAIHGCTTTTGRAAIDAYITYSSSPVVYSRINYVITIELKEAMNCRFAGSNDSNEKCYRRLPHIDERSVKKIAMKFFVISNADAMVQEAKGSYGRHEKEIFFFKLFLLVVFVNSNRNILYFSLYLHII